MPFCLDYAVSFWTFDALSRAAAEREVRMSPAVAVGAGLVSGLAAAVALWPVDVVRSIATTGGQVPTRRSFAVSLVPFSGAYLGIFFGFRPPNASVPEKVGLAALATAAGLLLELPLDHAKHALLGGGRFEAAVLSGIRLPLATMLLLVFEKIAAPLEGELLQGQQPRSEEALAAKRRT
mmetsp:Transcript_24354/g.78688  ORF Transcript_24354/g.78688 Transcript_24354/m.78688 type:complete len:179 (-) Transcript_24354:41-577(-)